MAGLGWGGLGWGGLGCRGGIKLIKETHAEPHWESKLKGEFFFFKEPCDGGFLAAPIATFSHLKSPGRVTEP